MGPTDFAALMTEITTALSAYSDALIAMVFVGAIAYGAVRLRRVAR